MARKVTRIDNSYNKYSPEVVARPVDTYVTPARDTGNAGELRSLAESLAGLHAPLSKYAKTRQAEREQTGIAEGQKLYNENPDRLSWEDYVKQNPTIPVNPFMKRGYLMARASNEADILKTALYQAYNDGSATVEINGRTVNIAESDDKAAFDTWVRGFTNKYIMENMGDDVDPEIYSGILMPQVEESVRALTNQHIAHRQDVLLTKTVAEYDRLFQNVMRDAVDEDGQTNADGAAGNIVLAGRLSVIAREMHARGVPLTMTESTIVASLVKAAEVSNIRDIDQLTDIARNITIIDGAKLGDNPALAVQIQKSLEAVELDREREEERARVRQERERKDKAEALRLDVMEEAWNGKKVTRARMTEAINSGFIRPEDADGILASVRSIEHYLKPPTDPAATAAAIRKRDDALEYNMLRFLEQNPDADIPKTIEASGMSDSRKGEYLKRFIDDRRGEVKEFRVDLGRLEQRMADEFYPGETPEQLRERRPQLLAASAKVAQQMYERAKLDPSLLTDFVKRGRLEYDLMTSLAGAMKLTTEAARPFVENGGSSANWDGMLELGKVHTEAQKYGSELSRMVQDYNDTVARGLNPSATMLVRFMNDSGVAVERIEAITGMKVVVKPQEQKAKNTSKPKDPMQQNMGGGDRNKYQGGYHAGGR